ncbi:MAG: hypothetical protein L0287_17100 [Anaerolineae bacterium]|nr:hypothetical protein [Anaerolineae bacterium]
MKTNQAPGFPGAGWCIPRLNSAAGLGSHRHFCAGRDRMAITFLGIPYFECSEQADLNHLLPSYERSIASEVSKTKDKSKEGLVGFNESFFDVQIG